MYISTLPIIKNLQSVTVTRVFCGPSSPTKNGAGCHDGENRKQKTCHDRSVSVGFKGCGARQKQRQEDPKDQRPKASMDGNEAGITKTHLKPT